MGLSLDPRLDPHQHSEPLLSVDVTSSMLISSLGLLKRHVLPWPVLLDISGSLVGPVWQKH